VFISIRISTYGLRVVKSFG